MKTWKEGIHNLVAKVWRLTAGAPPSIPSDSPPEADDRIEVQKLLALNRLTAPLIGHFGNLLTVLGGHAQLLHTRLAAMDEPELESAAREIVETADRAAGLVRQMMFIRGEQSPPRERMDLNALIAGMRKPLSAICGGRITVHTVLGSGLWPVKASPNQMEQLVANLVANARDATPDGGTIIVRTRNLFLSGPDGSRRPYVLLEVRDTGRGMDEATKSRIFDPFFSTKPPEEGEGLGLAVVHSVVAQHDGRIEVASEPGRGATVSVYLPRYEAPRPVPEAAPAASPGPRPPAALVVESEDSVRRLIASALHAEGYFVLEAAGGGEAIELASLHLNELELVVSEFAASEVTGPELATRLSLLRPSLKVLYISSSPKLRAWDEYDTPKNRAVLFKPFSPGELSSRLAELRAAVPHHGD